MRQNPRQHSAAASVSSGCAPANDAGTQPLGYPIEGAAGRPAQEQAISWYPIAAQQVPARPQQVPDQVPEGTQRARGGPPRSGVR